MEEVKDTTVGYIKFCDCCYPSKKFTNRQKFYEHKNPRVRMSKKTGSIPAVEVKGSSVPVSTASLSIAPLSELNLNIETTKFLDEMKILSKVLKTENSLINAFEQILKEKGYSVGNLLTDSYKIASQKSFAKNNKTEQLRETIASVNPSKSKKDELKDLGNLSRAELVEEKSFLTAKLKVCEIHLAGVADEHEHLYDLFGKWISTVSNRRDNNGGESQTEDVDLSYLQNESVVEERVEQSSSSSSKRKLDEPVEQSSSSAFAWLKAPKLW